MWPKSPNLFQNSRKGAPSRNPVRTLTASRPKTSTFPEVGPRCCHTTPPPSWRFYSPGDYAPTIGRAGLEVAVGWGCRQGRWRRPTARCGRRTSTPPCRWPAAPRWGAWRAPSPRTLPARTGRTQILPPEPGRMLSETARRLPCSWLPQKKVHEALPCQVCVPVHPRERPTEAVTLDGGGRIKMTFHGPFSTCPRRRHTRETKETVQGQSLDSFFPHMQNNTHTHTHILHNSISEQNGQWRFV